MKIRSTSYPGAHSVRTILLQPALASFHIVIATILLGISGFSCEGMVGPIAIEPAAGNTLTVARAGAGTGKGALFPEAMMEGCPQVGGNRTVKFAADIVSHEADWRGGLRWMVNHYPDFFNPPNPMADEIGGCGSYSRSLKKLDETEVSRRKKMAYRFNWAASFDFPYFGMYLPPMPNADATWESSGYDTQGNFHPNLVEARSYRIMNDFCRDMKENGFYQLSYFNVTEFGSRVGKPDEIKKDLPKDEIWKDATTEIYTQFPNAVMKTDKNAPYSSWSGSVAVDPGDPTFHAHLLEMAQRHIDNLPDAAGICIDRMDWIGRINYGADDGIGWYGSGRPGRSIAVSWINMMTDLGKLMHSNGKVMFGNPSWIHRLDIVRNLDGFYDEFGHDGFFLNGSSLLALRKPAIMWSGIGDQLHPDKVDGYFQEHLYMGAFTTAPIVGNDHCILPGPNTDQIYFDYGPLLDALRGKKWVLEPHCVEAAGGMAKVNLFSVPGGWSMPVVFGPQDGGVTVSIRNVPGITANLKIEALQPGVDAPQPVPAAARGGCPATGSTASSRMRHGKNLHPVKLASLQGIYSIRRVRSG
jgi:hypothetical protein